jgi:hypothetical protein
MSLLQSAPVYRPETPKARMRIYDRMRRWVIETDPRIVRRFWPARPEGSVGPFCPVCGLTLEQDEPVQTAIHLPPGRARDAIRTGGLEALTPDMPIESGELWYTICLRCLQQRPGSQEDGLLELLEAVADEALRSERLPVDPEGR